MKIDILILGSYQTNCYVLGKNQTDKDCLIIDTGLESEKLMDFLVKNELNPLAAVFTHGHADHICGIPLLREKYPDIKIYIHTSDAEMLTNSAKNLSMLAGAIFKTDAADILVEENDMIELAGIKLKVICTPGHTPGGISLYAESESVVFAGDTLFADSIGRSDFPGGNSELLIDSIKQKLLTLPDETICYPGHGPQTTIAQEKRYNPFLQ